MLKFTDDGRLIDPGMAFFGITEAIGAFLATTAAEIGGAATGALGSLGVGAETAGIIGPAVGSGLVGAAEGGVLGAGEAAITGGNVLKGLEGGAITQGVIGGGGSLLESAGLGVEGADVLAGAAGGALSSSATGGNPLSGALKGGVQGAVTGLLAPSPTTGGVQGAGPGAAATAAPASVAAPGADLTNATAWESLDPALPMGGSALSAAPGGFPNLGSSFTASDVQLPTLNLDSSATAAAPGSVGLGAASGTPSNVSGVNAPSSLAPQSVLSGAPALATPTASDITPLKPPDVSGIPAATPASGGTSFDKFIQNPSANSAWNVIDSNPTTALSVGALGLDLLQGSQTPPGYKQILAEANSLNTQSGQLEGYLNSGQLPPGIMQSLNAATADAEASIRSQYASRGMSGSSAEAQDVSSAKTAEAGQAANIAMQLYTEGVSESQISSQLYGTIMNEAVQQDNALSSAIGNFAFAMAGGYRPPVVQNTGTV